MELTEKIEFLLIELHQTFKGKISLFRYMNR